MLLALGACCVSSVAHAQTIRIGEYNIDCSDQGNNGAVTGSTAGIPAVIQAMGQHSLAGNAQPVDVMALTEMLDTNGSGTYSTTLPALVNSLNALYGAGTYAFDPTLDNTGLPSTQYNGPSGLIYDSKVVQVVGAETLTLGNYPRAPMRYELEPVGGNASSAFYLYVSHTKSGSGTSNSNERAAETAAIRTDEATLPANASVIYTGDFNADPTDPEFTNLEASGQGQAFDPENNSTALNYLSEATYKLQYRDDYQLMTANVLNGGGTIQYVPNAFQVFGNNGSVASGSIDVAGNTALSDLSNGTTILGDMMQNGDQPGTMYGSDHLPIEADFTISTPEPGAAAMMLFFAVAALGRRRNRSSAVASA
jgi:hypothetical protein